MLICWDDRQSFFKDTFEAAAAAQLAQEQIIAKTNPIKIILTVAMLYTQHILSYKYNTKAVFVNVQGIASSHFTAENDKCCAVLKHNLANVSGSH